MYWDLYRAPPGMIRICADDEGIHAIDFSVDPRGERRNTPLINEVKRELEEYFSGKRKAFTLPLCPAGTSFQEEVWDVLLTIPYGETISYGEVAKHIGKPKASRAVGGAIGKNPISIIIPCHRVIGKNKKLVGYGGGMAWKKALLNLEGHEY